MKKISENIYEHYENNIKFDCIKRINGSYDIYVNTKEQGYFRCSIQPSLKACKQKIKEFSNMYYL